MHARWGAARPFRGSTTAYDMRLRSTGGSVCGRATSVGGPSLARRRWTSINALGRPSECLRDLIHRPSERCDVQIDYLRLDLLYKYIAGYVKEG
jgi:hypothetical protein